MKFSIFATIILSEAIHMKELVKFLGQAMLGDRMKKLNRLKALRDEYRTFDEQKLMDICKHDAGIKRTVAISVLKERRGG